MKKLEYYVIVNTLELTYYNGEDDFEEEFEKAQKFEKLDDAKFAIEQFDDDYKEDSAIYLVTEHISRNFIRCCDGIKDVSENDK